MKNEQSLELAWLTLMSIISAIKAPLQLQVTLKMQFFQMRGQNKSKVVKG